MAAAPGDEDPARVVDPHLLDLGVVEERLQRPEAGDPGDQLADHRAVVGDRRDGAGEAAVVVVADDVLGDAAYDERLALRVDALAAHALAHLVVEPLDQLVVGARRRRRPIDRQTVLCHGCLLPEKTCTSDATQRRRDENRGPVKVVEKEGLERRHPVRRQARAV